MQKQQKKNNGGARPKAKGRKRARRSKGQGQNAVMQTAKAYGTLDTRLTQGLKFGAAAPHDDFPDGGCRLAGEMPNLNDDTLGVYGGSAFTAAFAATAGTPGGLIGFMVNPTGYQNTTGWNNSMFGNGPFGAICQYFKRFRFRKLALIYEGTSATSTAGSIQVCYDNDPAAAINKLARTQTQTAGATSIGARFPVWSPRVIIPLIEEKRSNGADKLHLCTAANATSTSTVNGTLDLLWQGAVTAFNDTPTATAQVYGRFRWSFVLDLYGFSNYSGDATLSTAPPLASAEPDSPVLIHPLSTKSRHFDDIGKERKEEASSQPRAASKK